MPIVEVKIVENVMLLPCSESDTVETIAAAAFVEYEKSLVQASPLRVLLIRDAKKRILSGNINIFEAGLDKYIEVVVESADPCDTVHERELAAMYQKWQLHFARQCLHIVQSLAAADSLSVPSSDCLRLLSELKHAEAEPVLDIILSCISILLRSFRSHFVTTYASKELFHIFQHSSHPSITLKALSLFKHTTALHPGDILNDVLAKISEHASIQGQLLRAFEEFKFQYSVETSRSKQTLPNMSPIQSHIENKVEKLPATITATSGMPLTRVIELLKSSDSRCRRFALEKLQTSSEGSQNDYISSSSSDMAIELVDALCICMKHSLTPPTAIKSSDEHEPIAALIAHVALCSETSELSSVTTCLKHIHRLLQLHIHSIAPVLQRIKLLITLLHADHRAAEVAGMCARLLQQCVAYTSWTELGIELEEVSLIYLLQRQDAVKEVALQYMLSLIQDTEHLSSVLQRIVMYRNYAILQKVWKCMLEEKGEAGLAALDIIAQLSVHSVVREFVLKYGGVDKILHSLSRSLLEHSTAPPKRQYLQRIRHELKLVTNLCAVKSSSMVTARVKKLLEDDTGDILREIAQRDDIIAFYVSMLTL